MSQSPNNTSARNRFEASRLSQSKRNTNKAAIDEMAIVNSIIADSHLKSSGCQIQAEVETAQEGEPKQVTLSGNAKSYFEKQMAQEAVARADKDALVLNEIVVNW